MPAAQAHADLLSSDPAGGSTLATAPTELRLTYSEAPDPTLSAVALLNSGASPVATGTPQVDGRTTLVVPITDPLADGTYTVTWRVVSVDDGHVTAGAFAFGVGTPPGAPAATTTTSSSGPTPLAIASKAGLYAGLMLLVAIAAIALGLFHGAPAARRRLGVVAGAVALLGALGFLVSQQRAIGVPLDTYLRSSAARTTIWLLVATAVAAAFALRRDARRSMGAMGRRRRGRDRARAPSPRGARRRGPDARARRDDPVGAHARRRLLGWRPAAPRAVAARAPSRSTDRRGTSLLEHGARRGRRRGGQRPHPGRRRARRVERAGEHAGQLVRADPRDQGDRRGPRDRPRRVQPDSLGAETRHRRPPPPTDRRCGTARDRRRAAPDGDAHQPRAARGRGRRRDRRADERGRAHRQRLRHDDRRHGHRHARAAGPEPVPRLTWSPTGPTTRWPPTP